MMMSCLTIISPWCAMLVESHLTKPSSAFHMLVRSTMLKIFCPYLERVMLFAPLGSSCWSIKSATTRNIVPKGASIMTGFGVHEQLNKTTSCA